MTVVLWFKRDLRVHDHAALSRAAELGPVLPLYIVEPEYWARPDTSGRQFAFLLECVDDLRGELARLGLTLCVRVGGAVDVLQTLKEVHKISHLVSHEETGNHWTYTRDKAVHEWASAQGVIWEELPQSGVVRRLKGRDGWAKARNMHVAQSTEPLLDHVSGIVADSQSIPALTLPDPCPHRQIGGRRAAMLMLHSFLDHRGETYRRDMSSPVTGETACSRLSPYLALGCVSVREIAQAARGTGRSADWAKSLKSFQSRLAWRDHFVQKLEDEPELEWRCLHSAYQGLRIDNVDLRQAWEAGRTGLPFVDACMRYLDATGWLNFRMRSMVMAVASYHLWLDWRLTGLHLARKFTDYEPGIHWSQVQMQSGTTGMNTVRIYNPIKQGLDQDPAGVFTRRWVPELRDVPIEHLQTPWKWDRSNDLDYPKPVVDVTEAARFARDRIYAVRKGTAFRTEASRVIHKHASRKDPDRNFVNDREPRRRAPRPSKASDPRQGQFDF